MMQVKEVSSKDLKREFSVTVPCADIEEALVARLNEIGKKAKIQGFRPGKAPLQIIRQRFGAEALDEVHNKLVSESISKALDERKLRPSQQPKVEVVKIGEKVDLEFKFAVEVLPEIKVTDFSKLSFEKSVADVEETRIDEAVTRLAKTMQEPELVTEARAAKKGDVLVIDFDGTVDGKSLPGMKADNHKIELGSKSFIDTFEDQLVGLKAGSKKDVKVKFPDDYHATELAGKKAVFAVNVKEIREYQPIVMDDALATKMGVASIAELRKHISNSIAGDYARIGRSVLKRHLMDELEIKHDFKLPEGMIEAEFDAIWKEVEKNKAKGELPKEDQGKSDAELKKEYKKIAERRIRLGLLLAQVAESNKIEVGQGELRNAMIAEARRFPGQEKAVIDYYVKTQGAMERLRAPILEEKVIDFILSQAKIKEKKISAEELLKLPDETE